MIPLVAGELRLAILEWYIEAEKVWEAGAIAFFSSFRSHLC
ncbi:MAG TPA: hypothetical protein V6C85_06020 [Allocoleopsis sp.]